MKRDGDIYEYEGEEENPPFVFLEQEMQYSFGFGLWKAEIKREKVRDLKSVGRRRGGGVPTWRPLKKM